MASKKDKLGKAARSRVEESMGQAEKKPAPPGDMQGFVESVKADARELHDSAGRAGRSADTPASPPVDSGAGAVSRPDDSAPPPRSAPTPRESDSREFDLPPNRASGGLSGNSREASERYMPRARDSIYNVSSDIRLEDYTENAASGGGGRFGSILRFGGGAVLALILAYGVFLLWGWLTAPDYRLAISNDLIDETNADLLHDEERPVVDSTSPVYVRFDWESEEDIETDYLTITIRRAGETSDGDEEAVMGRRKPGTAKYVYFMGPLDSGDYRVDVTDRDGEELLAKDFTVQ